jgi:hypothetical protein
MPAIKRTPTEIHFEDKVYDYFTNNDDDLKFDFYLLKSTPNVRIFEVEDDCQIKIYTSKFPTGYWGCGYDIDLRILTIGDEQNKKCFASGPGGSRSFENEFDATIFMINYILKHCLIQSWHSNKMKNKLSEFINPKSLF